MDNMHNDEIKLLKEAYESVKDKMPYVPEIGIILGSGLGSFVENINVDKAISFDCIKNFPRATNKCHRGLFVFAKINGKNCVIAQGRVHHYEGYDTTTAVRTIRLMKMFGISTLYVTNAAGGINSSFHVGDVMLITDHISFFISNPLIGENIDCLGIRFPDMSDPYDKELQEKIVKAADKYNISLVKGVYVQLTGPTFETHAEIKALRLLGADAVGMSTVIEVIAARHAGIKVAGMSMITNLTAGLTTKEQSDLDVRDTALKYSEKLIKIISEVI